MRFSSSIYSTGSGRMKLQRSPQLCSLLYLLLWQGEREDESEVDKGRGRERETGDKGSRSLTGTVFALYCEFGQEESCKSSLQFPVCKSLLAVLPTGDSHEFHIWRFTLHPTNIWIWRQNWERLHAYTQRWKVLQQITLLKYFNLTISIFCYFIRLHYYNSWEDLILPAATLMSCTY